MEVVPTKDKGKVPAVMKQPVTGSSNHNTQGLMTTGEVVYKTLCEKCYAKAMECYGTVYLARVARYAQS